MSAAVLILALLLAPAAVASVPAEDVRIEVRVTSVAGSSLYIDHGASDGLAEGDRVQFRLDGNAAASGVVVTVSANSARVELDPGAQRPPVRTRGEVFVPDTRPGAVEAARDAANSTAPSAVDHPPWTHPPETWSQDRPLLAPAFGIPPEERESRVHGRTWIRFDGTWGEDDQTYTLGAMGADATLDNPFGDGGAVRFDAEVFVRQSDVADGLYGYDDTRLRIDRLSYELGGTKDRPNRFAFGRFLQKEFPELGLLDGAEWSHRTQVGSRFGASLGWMPEPFADLTSFQDVQAALFYRHAFDADERATLGAAYQNTWHDGEQDRNLFVLQGEVRPSRELSLRASAWVDIYTSDDVLKDSGPELTEAQVSGTWTAASGAGVSLYLFERRFPEILRDEFLEPPPREIVDGVLDRAGVNGWVPVSTRVRMTGRFEIWSDQSDEGLNGEIGASLRDALGDSSDLSGTLLWADGSYSSGPGARLQARKTIGTTTAGLGWQSFWYDQKDYGGDDSELAQHSLFGSLDVALSERWDLSLLFDRSIGDDLDSWTAGFLLQMRF